jgi:6-phosphogluconolactonase (cycloisomerase 2 family)
VRLRILALALVALAISPPPAHANVPGTLTQIGCILDSSPTEDCVSGRGLRDAAYMAISPDGRFVYVPGRDSDAIAILRVDPLTGLLSQAAGPAGCLGGGSGAPTDCTPVTGLDRPSGIAITADGRAVFVASTIDGTLTVFRRSRRTGVLSPAGCFQDAAATAAIAGCAPVTGLRGAAGVVVTPDGRSVYVAAEGASAIVLFSRDPASGVLTPAGCLADSAIGATASCTAVGSLDAVRSLAASADGRSLYAAAPSANAVVGFARDPGGGLTKVGCLSGDDGVGKDPACGAATALGYAQQVAVSPDGRFVYVNATDSAALVAFARDAATSGLAQVPPPEGCRSDFDYGPTTCEAAPGMAQSLGIAITHDGRYLYTGSFTYGSIVSFTRDPGSGLVTPLGRCISAGDPRCETGTGLDRAGYVALSPNARFLYANSTGSGGLAVFARQFEIHRARVKAKRARARRGAVRLPLACPRGFIEGCFGTLRLAIVDVRGGLRITNVAGPATFDVPSGKRRTIKLKLRGKAIRRLHLSKRFTARAIAVSRDGSGATATAERSVRVRR